MPFDTFSRRTFASFAAGALLQGTQIAAGAEPTGLSDPGPKPPDLSLADWGEVRAKYSNMLRVYGERLSPAEKKRAVKVLIQHQHMLASIRKFVVQNEDPSACTLRLYGAEHV
jgi:hypothetical protein